MLQSDCRVSRVSAVGYVLSCHVCLQRRVLHLLLHARFISRSAEAERGGSVYGLLAGGRQRATHATRRRRGGPRRARRAALCTCDSNFQVLVAKIKHESTSKYKRLMPNYTRYKNKINKHESQNHFDARCNPVCKAVSSFVTVSSDPLLRPNRSASASRRQE